MKRNGFIGLSLLYPISVMVTGIMAVFLSTSKSNKILNAMKLDIDTSIFDSVTCDCEVINNTLKKYGERINTVDKTIDKLKQDLDNIKKVGDATASQILTGRKALVRGQLVTGTMPDRRFTGNVTGGLNTSYPNIALNVGGNTQLTTGTNGVDYIATSPPQGWYEGGGSSYTVIPKSTVISLYGITADKIVKGQSIAGVAGTAANTNDATAVAGDILSGKTAYVKNQKITGTMPTMQGSGHVDVSETVAGNHSQNGTSYLYYKVPPHTYTGDVEWLRSSYADVASRIGLTAGKLLKGESVLGITGTGETTCPPSLDTSDATAGAADILKDKTAYVNGSKVTGSMVSRGAYTDAVSVAYAGGTIYTRIPAGAYLTNTEIGYPEVIFSTESIGIKPEKIIKGQSIAGIEGTASSFADHRFASEAIQDMSAEMVTTYSNGTTADRVKNTWKDWNALTDAGGTYNDNADQDTTWMKTTSWNIDINNNFYQAGKVEIYLTCYDGTETSLWKAGDTEFYTRVVAGYQKESTDTNTWGVIPKVVILKEKNSWEIKSVQSNIDFYQNQSKIVLSDENTTTKTATTLNDKGITWSTGFYAIVNNDHTKLYLEYESSTQTENTYYHTIRYFSTSDKGDAAESKWLDSSASDDYYSYGLNAAGTRSYWYKRDGNYKISYGKGRLRLSSKYNHWYVSMNYYD